MNTLFSNLRDGEYFRIPGYDDLFQKLDSNYAKALGCAWIRKPVRFARKGETILITTPGADLMVIAMGKPDVTACS